jgi:hypothetical protein
MLRWQFWQSIPKQHSPRPAHQASLRLEALEDRNLLNAPGLTVAPGYTVTTFATAPAGASQPDSIIVDGSKVFVGYGNGVAKDGSDGKSSTIVEYNSAGALLKTFSVPGHNDGLKVDPRTHLLWALQNEDGNPNLVIINPNSGKETKYTFDPVANGGGFDDITFVDGKVFLSESNPSSNPNTAPAVVEAFLHGTEVDVKTVLLGNAKAFDLTTHKQVTLNLQDPDSMTADLHGNLVLTSQADDEIITIHNPGEEDQFTTVLPLPVSVDDTLFRHGDDGVILLTDQGTGTIYKITGSALGRNQALSAALDAGQLGVLNVKTGAFTPVITGLTNPRGLALLQVGEEGHHHDDWWQSDE